MPSSYSKNKNISVAMSVYNDEEYVKESIESILNQTYSEFDFIIVDDCSTDNSSQILKNFQQQDEGVTLIENQQNLGLTKSLNKAIDKSEGKYVARMDADDIAEPKRLEKQVEFMEHHSQVGLLGTAYREIDAQGSVIGKKKFPISNEKLQEVLIKFNPFFHASVMIRKEVLDKVGLYNENFKKAQDYELWFRIAQDYKIANLPDFLMKRRYSPGSISIKNEDEQIFWAQQARKDALRRGQYPKWNYIYLLKPYLVSKIPFKLRKMIREQLLGSNIYE